jgi:PAS domain S-box-containing protein
LICFSGAKRPRNDARLFFPRRPEGLKTGTVLCYQEAFLPDLSSFRKHLILRSGVFFSRTVSEKQFRIVLRNRMLHGKGCRMRAEDIPNRTGRRNAVAAPRPAAVLPADERYYRALVEAAGDWIWEVDPKGRYTFSNRPVAGILGYLPEEVIGRTPFDFMPPAEAARMERLFREFADARKPFSNLENINLHKSGRRVVLETSAVPIFDEAGEFRGFRGIDRNVTARRKAEDKIRKARAGLERRVKRKALEAEVRRTVLKQEITIRQHVQAELLQSKHQFRALVETLNEGFGIVDAEGRLTYVNGILLEMLGYARRDVLGKTIGDLADEENAALLQKQLALHQQGIEAPCEIQFTARDGRSISTIVSPRAMFDSAGGFQGCFAVITDISSMKTTERALRHREQQLREKTVRLQEMNTALEVLLRKREEDKAIIQKRLLFNIMRLVAPYLDALAETRLNERQRFLVNILKTNLSEVLSPFATKLSTEHTELTNKEIEIANLVKMGKSTAQIAADLNISYKTAEAHRWRIRKKLGLTRRRANLTSYLSRMEDPLWKLGDPAGKNQV